ncbi:MAG: hypothetical protein WCC04_21770 [Terriglobales bacterium]
MGKLGYQIRQIGKPAGESWNEKQGATCAEWAQSPEGREVVVIDLPSGEVRVLSREESQQVANEYNRLRA